MHYCAVCMFALIFFLLSLQERCYQLKKKIDDVLTELKLQQNENSELKEEVCQ